MPVDNSGGRTHFFCALPSEAEALIRAFQLKEDQPPGLFRRYQSASGLYCLVISGSGRLNAAAAVAWHLAGARAAPADVWLNIGIAGHGRHPLGGMYLAHKITERQSGRHWYPQIVAQTDLASAPLITLDRASANYEEALFDMEASGFYEMARRAGTAELIHCLKVISDNAEQPVGALNAGRVKALIAAQIDQIKAFVLALQTLSRELAAASAPPAAYQGFIDRWHFSQTERVQLLRLLRRWQLRLPGENPLQSVRGGQTAREILHGLRQALEQQRFKLHD